MPGGIPKRKLRKILRYFESSVSSDDVLGAWLAVGGHNLRPMLTNELYWGISRANWELVVQYSGLTEAAPDGYMSDRFAFGTHALEMKSLCQRRLGLNGVAVVVDYDYRSAFNALLVVDEVDFDAEMVWLYPADDGIIAIHDEPPSALRGGFVLF